MTIDDLPIPDLLVEQLALGELPPAKAAEVRRRLTRTGQLDRLQALAADSDAILRDYPPRMVAAALAPPRPARRPWLVLPVLAAAAAAIIVALPGPQTADTPPDDPAHYVGIKGPTLSVVRIDEAVPLADGTVVQAGDQVQVFYNLPFSHLTHGAVYSVDGDGVVTRHYVGPMDPIGNHALPQSFQLDDAPQYERFTLIADDQPIIPSAIETALRRGEPLSAPEGGLIDTFTLIKE